MSTANQLREQYESQDRFLHVASAHYGYFLPGIDAIYFMDWAEHCGSKKPRIGTKVLRRPLVARTTHSFADALCCAHSLSIS